MHVLWTVGVQTKMENFFFRTCAHWIDASLDMSLEKMPLRPLATPAKLPFQHTAATNLQVCYVFDAPLSVSSESQPSSSSSSSGADVRVSSGFKVEGNLKLPGPV